MSNVKHHHRCDVVICGAGVGGLVLGLVLARRGITVEVVEQLPEPPMPRRAEHLQPNGLKVLDQLGLLSTLRNADIHLNQQFHFLSIDPAGGGRSLCLIDYSELPGPYPYTVLTTPAVLQPILVRALEAEPNARCRWATSVVGLRPERDEQRVIAKSAEGEPMELRARVVIGADGVRSTIRQAASIDANVHLYRDGYATMIVPRPERFGSTSLYAVGGGEIMALFPVSKAELAILYMVSRTRWPAVRAADLGLLKSRLAAITPVVEPALESVTSWEQVGYMPCLRVRASTWVADRVALMGDAAHAMNPHVAQGRNQAMVDALVLADVIEDGLRQNDLSRTQLLKYELARRARVEILQRAADEMVWYWNTGWWPLQWMRERVLTTLGRNRRLRGRMMALVGGLPVRPYTWIERFQAAGLLPDRRADEMVHHEGGSP